MYRIDLEDFVSCIIDEDSEVAFSIDGSIMTQVRRELLTVGISCDFSPGAIDTFAFHYPKNVYVSHFQISVRSSSDFAHKMCEVRTNSELKDRIYPIWKKVKKQSVF